jgi:hypothetical protein
VRIRFDALAAQTERISIGMLEKHDQGCPLAFLVTALLIAHQITNSTNKALMRLQFSFHGSCYQNQRIQQGAGRWGPSNLLINLGPSNVFLNLVHRRQTQLKIDVHWRFPCAALPSPK